MLAFREALAFGADALELDVRLSRDEVAVVMHDASVDRTTNGSGLVADQDLEDLQRLDAGQGESVPTLDAVLEEFQRVPLIVEVKEARAAAAVVTALQVGLTRPSLCRSVMDAAPSLMRGSSRPPGAEVGRCMSGPSTIQPRHGACARSVSVALLQTSPIACELLSRE